MTSLLTIATMRSTSCGLRAAGRGRRLEYRSPRLDTERGAAGLRRLEGAGRGAAGLRRLEVAGRGAAGLRRLEAAGRGAAGLRRLDAAGRGAAGRAELRGRRGGHEQENQGDA